MGHVANFLGHRGSFSPGHKSPEDRGANGLPPEYFVKNAIAWHAEHPEVTKGD
jgi:hypothetical protein